MLSDIRRNAQHPLLKIILGLIVVVFILYFGYASSSRQSPDVAGEVNGVSLSRAEYEDTLRRLVDFYRQISQGQLSEEQLIQMGNLRERAFELLEDRVLLAEEADRRDITVTDAELDAAIQGQPTFQVNGRFDNDRYLQALSSSGLRHKQYRELKRSELMMTKVEQAIRDSAIVSDADVEAEYKARKTTAVADYAAFDPVRFAAEIAVTDELLGEYLAAEGEAFRTQEKRAARYVLFATDAFTKEVNPSGAQLAEEYKARSYLFQEAESVHARHLLVGVAKDAPEADWEKARARAEELGSGIADAKAFAAAAKRYSQDSGSQPQGGDLGWFERGRMVPAFEEAAFSLPVGEVSLPVRTEFGYHLIFVEAKRPTRQAPLEEVKERLVTILKNEGARKLAAAAANDILVGIEDHKIAWDALPDGLKAKTTPLVTRLEQNPALPAAEEFVPTLFAMAPDAAGLTLDTPEGTYIIAPATVVPAGIPALADIRAAVEGRYREAEGRKAAEAAANAFIASAAAKGWNEALKAEGLKAAASEPFTAKEGRIDPLGAAPEAAQALLDLPEVGQLAPKAYGIDGKFYALRLSVRTPADLAGLETERETIRAELLPDKREKVFADKMDELRKAAKIERNPALLATI